MGGDAEGEGGEGVGALEDQGGFSLGKAPDGAKPAVSVRVGEPSPGKMPGPGQVVSTSKHPFLSPFFYLYFSPHVFHIFYSIFRYLTRVDLSPLF